MDSKRIEIQESHQKTERSTGTSSEDIILLRDENNTPEELAVALQQASSVLSSYSSASEKPTNSANNTTQNITNSLQNAIVDAGYELELYQAWTEGGSHAVSPILTMLADSIIKDDKNKNQAEDLMQIMVFDLLLHQKEWGLNFNDIKIGGNVNINPHTYFGYITENFGSGMHNDYYGKDNAPPKKVIGWFIGAVIPFAQHFMSNNKIPEHSITAKVVKYFTDDKNKKKLWDLSSNYNVKDSISYQGTSTTKASNVDAHSTSTHVSPALKLFFLGQAAYSGKISAEQWDDFIVADIQEMKKMLGLEGKTHRDLAQWLVDQKIGWTFDGSGQLDFNKGNKGGIPVKILNKFFNNFPSRILTDKELKEINRIGDNVKMIQQTLKYWIQIMRDENISIARNI